LKPWKAIAEASTASASTTNGGYALNGRPARPGLWMLRSLITT